LPFPISFACLNPNFDFYHETDASLVKAKTGESIVKPGRPPASLLRIYPEHRTFSADPMIQITSVLTIRYQPGSCMHGKLLQRSVLVTNDWFVHPRAHLISPDSRGPNRGQHNFPETSEYVCWLRLSQIKLLCSFSRYEHSRLLDRSQIENLSMVYVECSAIISRIYKVVC
jgi:hypothetical protein